MLKGNTVMKYRLGIIDDIDNISILISDAIKEMESKGIHQWDEKYPTAEDFRDDISKGYLYVVMEKEKLAAIYVISGESDDAYKTVDWYYPNETAYILHRFCVSPDFQNRGLGKQILMHIEAQIKEMGYQSVRLDVFTENPYAQKLYRHNGYEVRGYADWRKGRFELMEKHL